MFASMLREQSDMRRLTFDAGSADGVLRQTREQELAALLVRPPSVCAGSSVKLLMALNACTNVDRAKRQTKARLS